MPLRQIALGLLLVALGVQINGFDLLMNPLGWVLVIGASQRITGEETTRASVTTAAVVAFLVSVPLAVPRVTGSVANADPSIAWVLSLPQLAVVLLLARHLTATARAGGDVDAAAWWRWASTGAIVVALAPVIAYPTGSEELIGLTLLLGLAVIVFTLVLLLRHAGRPWAIPTGPVISPADPPAPS